MIVIYIASPDLQFMTVKNTFVEARDDIITNGLIKADQLFAEISNLYIMETDMVSETTRYDLEEEFNLELNYVREEKLKEVE